MDSQKYRQPYAEDYFSDDGQGNGVSIDAFTPEPSPGKANVRTKRSNPEDMGTEKTPTGRVPTFDVKSDSGYSSQSVAGMSSADSAASATSSQRSPPVVPANAVPAAPSPTPAQRAPRPPPQRQPSTQSTQSTQSAPRLSRRDSQASRRPTNERRPTISQAPPKRRDSRNVDECTVPGCTKCGPDAVEPRPRPSRRQSMLHQPAESAPDVSYRYPHDTRSQVSDPAQYHPSSPTDSRPPRQYHAQSGPIVQPAISRRLSTNSRPARPTSYHGDPRDSYRPQPSMHQERGPPPSKSALFGYPQQPPQHPPHPMGPGYMAPPYGPPNPYFTQAQQMQPMPPPQPYEPQRPHLSARGPSMSGHAQNVVPVVTQVAGSRDRPISTRYSSYTSAVYPPEQRLKYEEDEDSESDSESESEEEYENEPPRRPVRRITDTPDAVAPQRRPSMRHAVTTPALDRAHRKPQTVVVERPSRTDRERERALRSDRRKSVSRPPLVPPIKSQSEYPTPRARIIVENPQSDRRQSRQEYDMSFDGRERASRREYNVEQRRQNRSSKVYDTGRDFEREYDDDDDDDDSLDTRAPLSNRHRRDTDVDTRRRTQRPVEVKKKVDDAENYINAGRGDQDTYADQAYEVARKRSSRVSGGPSEAESSRSKGSDKTNGEIRLRIGNDAPVTLSLNGDMEGRTVQLVPGENGMNELVISGNSRSGETIYHSERGSVRRAITSASQVRRDAEEMTDRSSQSSRRRRGTRDEQDEPRRVLHSRRPRADRRGEAEYRR